MYRTTAQSFARTSRRSVARSAGRRHESIQASVNTAPASSQHVVAGLAGGGAVLLVGYGYYHYSGAAKIINTAKSMKETVANATGTLKDATPDANAAIKMLRSYAHTYAAAIPGASVVLDKAFDAAENAVREHGPEAQKMLQDSYQELQTALKNTDGKDAQEKILTIITTAAKKLQGLGADFDASVLQPLLEKSPALKDALSGSQEQLLELAKQHGPKAKQIYDDTMSQVQQISSQGLNGSTIASIVTLVSTQIQKIKDLGQAASKDAYSKLSKDAERFTNSLPDVKKLIDDKMPALESTLGKDGVKQVQQFYGEFEDFLKSSKGKDSKTLTKDAKAFATKKLAELQDTAQNMTPSGVMNSVPGLASIGGLGGVGATLSELHSVANKHGPEAKNLMDDTMKEVTSLLEKKLEEAKKLGKKAAADSKDAAKENLKK